MPMFHHLWLAQGTGNANFFYASTLVFACANGAALIEGVWAGLRIAIGPGKEGYSVSQEWCTWGIIAGHLSMDSDFTITK